MIKKFVLVLVSIWWGWTVLIDFAVVPTVFSTIRDFFNAGELGIALFSKLNKLELVVSSSLIVLSVFQIKKEGQGKIQLALSCLAWIIVMIYFVYLTPKIIYLTDLWKQTDATQSLGIARIADVQQEHQLFHRIYVSMDSIKLLILTCFMGLGIFQKEVQVAKA